MLEANSQLSTVGVVSKSEGSNKSKWCGGIVKVGTQTGVANGECSHVYNKASYSYKRSTGNE